MTRLWPLLGVALVWVGHATADGVDPDLRPVPICSLSKGTESQVVWRVRTGNLTGAVALTRGKVLVGARFSGPSDTTPDGPAAMLCLNSDTGALLWRADHAALPWGRVTDIGMPIVSTPWIEENRAWYLSNRGELVCVDIEGFHDGKNHGTQANIIWSLDMVGELGVFKRGAGDVGSPMGSPIVWGDLVFCVTGEGRRPQDHPGMAPSFLAVHKTTGKVVWSSAAPGQNIIYAQWSSPVIAHGDGKDQVIFPGGDGWLYAFEPQTGQPLWKTDCNDPAAKPWKIDGPGLFEAGKMKLFFMGAPVVHDNTLFVGLNLDLEFQAENAPLQAISLGPQGGIVRWKFQHPEFVSTYGSAAVSDGIVYVLGYAAVLFALDEKTGRELWHSKFCEGSHSWFYGGPLVSNGRVFVGDEEGQLFIFAAGPQKKCLARYEFPEPLWSAPVVDKKFIYLPTQQYLWKLRLP